MNHSPHRRQVLTQLGAAALGASVWPQAAASEGIARIGQVLPLSGPLAATVTPLVEGQKAALAEVHAKGLAGGLRMEITTLDDGFDPKRTLECSRELMDGNDVHCLFGYVTGGGIAALLPELLQRKIPLIGIYNGADQLRAKPHPYLFTTTASWTAELTQLLRTLAMQSVTRISLVHADHDIGRSLLKATEAIAHPLGVKVIASAALAVDGSNAAAAARDIGAQDNQAVLFTFTGAAQVAFMKTAVEVIKVPIYGLSIGGSETMLKALGPASRGLALAQVLPYPWRTTSALTRQFTLAMKAASLPLSYERMWGYLNVMILAEALRRSSKTVTPGGIVSAMESMNDVDLGGYRLNYSKTNHHGSNFVELTMVGHDGRYVR